ncbi:RICIN domain-containing protein [Streptomyces sp. G5(2025)]|uniref:RICIN domain-containing protein n=1 Tax=Streptomyces sp. G5(2025) TaxID=3406628 RepID=UPI003C1FFEAB
MRRPGHTHAKTRSQTSALPLRRPARRLRPPPHPDGRAGTASAASTAEQNINIVSTHSGMCLEVGTATEGEVITQRRCAGRENALWTLKSSPLGGGSYQILNVYSGKCVAVENSSPSAGALPSAVAVQRACAQAVPPRTYLEEVGTGRYRIQWHHPEFGVGCLTVMNGGPVPGMPEPWDACGSAGVFLVEPVETPAPGGFRIREAATGQCLGMVGGGTAEGIEAMRQSCTAALSQEFFIDPE